MITFNKEKTLKKPSLTNSQALWSNIAYMSVHVCVLYIHAKSSIFAPLKWGVSGANEDIVVSDDVNEKTVSESAVSDDVNRTQRQ